MKIVQISHYRLPVLKYGGTQRVIYWNSKAIAELGHKVYLISREGTEMENVEVIFTPGRVKDYNPYIPDDADIAHIYYTPEIPIDIKHIITIEGNGKPGERFLPNTVGVSRDHAARHGFSTFVYNGLDPREYLYREKKDDYFLFLSKVSWRVKGVKIAIELAKRMGFKLIIAGGWRLSMRKNIKYCGEVGGVEKSRLLAGARALIFPIQWEEPFGLAAIEALVSGTPVITTNRGAMSEIVTPEVGFRCDTTEQMEEAVKNIHEINPADCRKRVMDGFTAKIMAKNYVKLYDRLLAGGKLN